MHTVEQPVNITCASTFRPGARGGTASLFTSVAARSATLAVAHMWKAKSSLGGTSAAKLVPMEETPYAAEVLLQKRLAPYPDLLPGDQINPDSPRRWLLVTREMPVPDEVDENASSTHN